MTSGKQRPFRRPKKFNRLRERPVWCYDLETDPIHSGPVPAPRYFTLSNTSSRCVVSKPTIGFDALHAAIIEHMLTPELVGTRFVAYNGNNFDMLVLTKALEADPDYVIEPYLTRSKQLRGATVRRVDNPKTCWYFSDAIAMFGFQGKLADFLESFAPEHHKLHTDVLDFDVNDPEAVRYAENDTTALVAAVEGASRALDSATHMYPQNTIGKLAVKYFQNNLPEDVLIWQPPMGCRDALIRAKLGGYVNCAGTFYGPVWKVDINQSYAHQMRKPLPSGRCVHVFREWRGKLGLYHVVLYRSVPDTRVPFYTRPDGTYARAIDGSEPVRTWVTSVEIEYLRKYGWTVLVGEGYVWSDQFTMKPMVDALEQARMTCPGGPKGPIGKMIKAVGNNAYGKTVEQHDGIRYVQSATCPGEGYIREQAEELCGANIWLTKEEPKAEDYHRMQLGVFILAYGRVQVMEGAQAGRAFYLYSDTDCNVYAADVSVRLDIDPARYGAWKIEAEAEPYYIVAKKGYWSEASHVDLEDGRVKPDHISMKGMHQRDLTSEELAAWFHGGDPPKQMQTQRYNFIKTMTTGQMYRATERQASRKLEPFSLSGDD